MWYLDNKGVHEELLEEEEIRSELEGLVDDVSWAISVAKIFKIWVEVAPDVFIKVYREDDK